MFLPGSIDVRRRERERTIFAVRAPLISKKSGGTTNGQTPMSSILLSYASCLVERVETGHRHSFCEEEIDSVDEPSDYDAHVDTFVALHYTVAALLDLCVQQRRHFISPSL